MPASVCGENVVVDCGSWVETPYFGTLRYRARVDHVIMGARYKSGDAAFDTRCQTESPMALHGSVVCNRKATAGLLDRHTST